MSISTGSTSECRRSIDNPADFASHNGVLRNTITKSVNANEDGKHAEWGIYAKAPRESSGLGIIVPRLGAYAEAGVGHAHAEYSILEGEANGPNVSIGAEVGISGLGAMARAEVGSLTGKVGPVGVKLGLGVDTGASVGQGRIEAKILGTGFSIGKKTSVALLGSEVECSIM